MRFDEHLSRESLALLTLTWNRGEKILYPHRENNLASRTKAAIREAYLKDGIFVLDRVDEHVTVLDFVVCGYVV